MTEKERELQEEFLFEEQELSEDEKELLEEIYDRLDIFEQINRPFHQAAKQCRQVIHMDDPEQDDPETMRRSGKRTFFDPAGEAGLQGHAF